MIRRNFSTRSKNVSNRIEEDEMLPCDLGQNRRFLGDQVNSIRLWVVIQGVLIGSIGMVHGISEILQGNTPTGGFLLESIGAFTLIPNYLITGIAATLTGFAVIVWTIGFIHKKNGPLIFLALALLLFLVGGGIAQVLFIILTWAVATRIHQPLTWWSKALPENLRKRLARVWLPVMILGYVFLLLGIGIWLVLTPPGATYKEPVIVYLSWTFLSLGFLCQILTIVAVFANDVESRQIGKGQNAAHPTA